MVKPFFILGIFVSGDLLRNVDFKYCFYDDRVDRLSALSTLK